MTSLAACPPTPNFGGGLTNLGPIPSPSLRWGTRPIVWPALSGSALSKKRPSKPVSAFPSEPLPMATATAYTGSDQVAGDAD